MKKNVMMRLAAILLVCVLASTCGISGTYAKYVTKAEGSDSARVAKWGVTVVVAGSELFSNEYEDTTNGLTVKSNDDQRVVAPGTSSDESTAMIFKVLGQPEVMVDITFALENVKDVFLKAGIYTDYTEVTGYDASNNPIYGKTFELTEDYYPVKFTLKQNGVIVAGCENVKLSVIEAYLEGATVTRRCAAGTDLNTAYGEYTLTWKWAFEDATDVDLYDAADTLLGNLMVDPSLIDAAKYNLTVGYKLTITATQVD